MVNCRFRTTLYAFAAVLPFLSGCGPRPPGPDDRLAVAVSILPEKWLVEQLAGPRVQVTTLVLPGDNPHTYQPSDAQVSRLMSSAVFFRLGVPFENGPWFHAIESARRLRIVDLRQGLELLDMAPEGHAHEAGGHEGGKDPHTWLSLPALKIQAATIARALGEIDPAHQADYDRRLADLQKLLDERDAALRAKLLPARGKAFFVFHPAWGYFARDYGLRQEAIEVEGKEPSDRELTEIQRQVRQSGAKVILVQPQISGRGAQAVARATGARVVTADPLAENVPQTLEQVADLLAKSLSPLPQPPASPGGVPRAEPGAEGRNK